MRTEPAPPPSEDDRLRYGLTATLSRGDLLDLVRSGSEGSLKSKPLTRVDGLEFASIGCGMLVLAEGDAFHVVLCLRALDVCCEYEIRARLACCVSVGDRPVSSCTMAEEAVWATGREIVTLPACLGRADLFPVASGNPALDADSDASVLVQFCFLLRITDTSPAFLKPSPVADFNGPTPASADSPDDEDVVAKDEPWVTLRCRDGSVRAPRLLLLTHSDYCRVLLTSPLWNFDSDPQATIHCDAEFASEMKRFLFYLQSYQCFSIARFETFRMLARIADQYGVPAVQLQCSRFLNHCLQLNAASRGQLASPTLSRTISNSGGMQTRLTWSSGDLVSLWLTCSRHLHEPQLQLAVMRAIHCHFPYSSVSQSQDFQFLQESDKNCFCHDFSLVADGGMTESRE